jgi:hypothetical protein
MSATFGAQWLDQLESKRVIEAANKGKHYRRALSPFDLSWIINEPFHNFESPIHNYLPGGAYRFFENARELVETRNRWYHDYSPHNVADLAKAIELCVYVATKCELNIAPTLEAIRKRVLQLKAGSYRSALIVPHAAIPEVGDDNPLVTPASPAQIQRAVGAVWLGPLPMRKIALKSTGELVDEGLHSNVTGELSTTQKERYLKLWQLMFKTGWLWVDDLGQVAAYVHGVLRCVGFWGEIEEPAQDPSAKFLLPHSYEITPDSLLDRSTGVELNEQHLGKVTESTLLRARMEIEENELVRVTWDGDLIWFSGNGVEYFGEVESQDWFADHFSISTE